MKWSQHIRLLLSVDSILGSDSLPPCRNRGSFVWDAPSCGEISYVQGHDSNVNGLEFVNFGMIFVGSQLVSASVTSPRMGCVPEAAGAHALQNKHKPGWLPGTVSGESVGQFINPLK